MKAFKSLLLIFFSLFILVSCGGKKQNQEASSEEAFDLDSYIKAAESIEPNLSSVDQIFNILDMVNAEYYDVLTNDPYNAHSYKSSYPVAAANLGVYMADVLYHYYGESEETMFLTFNAAQELAKYVGVQSKFATWTFEQLEGSVMRRDTITRLFNQLLEDSEQYGTQEELVFVHTAFLTGSFVEKVFISSNLLQQKLNAAEMTQEEEADIRELLVIYLNQLDPSTSILYEAFERQQEQLEGMMVLNTFNRLRELSQQLQKVKPTLALAPISEIAGNNDLKTTFGLIANLRTQLVTATG